MTDLSQEDRDYFSDHFDRQYNSAIDAALGAQGNPDHAARAFQLEKVTGEPASMILPDLDRVDQENKGRMAAEIVTANPSLQRYVQSNSLAAQLSNDDWARLDDVVKTSRGTDRPWAVTRGFVTGLVEQNPELYGEAAEALGHLVPQGSFAEKGLKQVPGLIKSIEPELGTYKTRGKRLRDVTNSTEAFETLGEMFGSGLASLAPVIAGAIIGGAAGARTGAAIGGLTAGSPLSLGEVYKALKDAGVPKEQAAGYALTVLPIMAGLDYAGLALGPLGQVLNLPGLKKEIAAEVIKQHLATAIAKGIVKGAAIEGLTEGLQEGVKLGTVTYATGKPLISIDNAFDVLEATIGGAMVGGALGGAGGGIQQRGEARQFDKEREQLKALERLLAPYVESGTEPPLGLHPALDKLKGDQAREGLDELKEQEKAAAASLTRERSPESVERIIEDTAPGNIYIPVDQVIKLYGDNMPTPEDGILGWVPNLMEQIRTMSLTNGNVVIPRSKWNVMVDPEISKGLHDFIRLRENAASLEDIKQVQAVREMAMVEAYHATPHFFEAFEISPRTMRTGEGAQSYMAGLYFAGNRATAEEYFKTFGSREAPVTSQNEMVARRALWIGKDNVAEALAYLDQESAKMTKGSAQFREHRAAHKMIREGYTVPKQQAHLLRTRLMVEPEQLLDWDQPLEKQGVRGQLAELRRSEEFQALQKGQVAGRGTWAGKTGEFIYRDIVGKFKDKIHADMLEAQLKWERSSSKEDLEAYKKALADNEKSHILAADMASDMLKRFGIPGGQYLDQQSRGLVNLAQTDIAALSKTIETLKASLEESRKRLVELEASGIDTVRGEEIRDKLQENIDYAELTIANHEARIAVAKKQAAEGTFNFVLFNANLAEIIDRNGEAVQAVRRQAGLERPLITPEKQVFLTRREPSEYEADLMKGEGKLHAFSLIDFRGKDIGSAFIREGAEGKTILVEHVAVDDKANALGPGAVMDLIRQVKEEFPNAEKLVGYRVSGARAAATERTGIDKLGVMTLDLKMADEQSLRGMALTIAEALRPPVEGEKEFISKRIAVTTGELSPVQKVMFKAVDTLLERIAPGARRIAAQKVEMEGTELRGVFISWNDRKPLIAWSFMADSPMTTGRHEAVHFLREYGFFTPDEWEALVSTAKAEDWVGKHKIAELWKDFNLTETQMLEEAIAEQYSKVWARTPGNVQGALAKAFEKLDMLLVQLKEAISKALGYTPTVDEIFSMIESGEIGARTETTRISKEEMLGTHKALPKQGELDVTRQGDKAIFANGAAIGTNNPHLKKILELMKEQSAEDIEAQRKRAIAFQTKVQTEAWKEESAILEDEVRADLRVRRDIAASEYFRYGELYGEKVLGPRPRFNTTLLTPEQKLQLPDAWQSPNGARPDDFANLFGFTTGQELIDHLANIEQARGKIRPGEFLHRLVKFETQRRMVAKHGLLEENILKEAEEHVLGSSQMDLLHELTLAVAWESGKEITMDKADVKDMVDKGFNALQAKAVSVQAFLNDSGKAARSMFEAASKEDFTEVFKQQQAQYYAGLMGREAVRFQKQMDQLERLMDRNNKRLVPGMDNDYLNAFQGLMAQAGLPTARTQQEIATQLSEAGWNTFAEFIATQRVGGLMVDIPEAIVQNPVKPWDEMTVLDRREFLSALRALNSVGRQLQKIVVDGVAHDFDTYRDRVVDNIKTLPKRDLVKGEKFRYYVDSWLVRMEEVVKDLDLRQVAGPLWSAVYRPLMEAKNKEYEWQEKLVKRLGAISSQLGQVWRDTLDDTIPNDFLIDPHSGAPFKMTRGMMVNIMLNWGNKSNIDKFIVGWFGKGNNAASMKGVIDDWLDKHATKADWEFVQHIWDIFGEWAEPVQRMYEKTSGIGPKMIAPEPVINRHGTFSGGYFPVIPAKEYNEFDPGDASGLFGGDYGSSTPANTYTLTRTGRPVKISFHHTPEVIAHRMQQQIHDLSYREPLITAWKLLTDKKVTAAIKGHYGIEYEKEIKPWLKRIAGNRSVESGALEKLYGWMGWARLNVIGHSLPLNLKVLGSPDMGAFDPRMVGRVMGDRQHYLDLIYAKMDDGSTRSKEIPHTFRNMDRDFREALEDMITKQGLKGIAADAVRAGFFPIVKFSQGFRILTWVKEYEQQLENGLDDGAAAAWADSIVRQRHGSGGLPDLPAIMGTNNEGLKWITMFYGFFNTVYNIQRAGIGAARRADTSTPEGRKAFGDVMTALYAGVLIPAAFGAALFNKWEKDDNWFTYILKALVLGQTALIPFAREIGTYAIEGRAPTTPWGSILQAGISMKSDIKKAYQGKKVEKPIQHAANIIGLTTRLPLGQIGRTAEFYKDVYTGEQRPQGFWQYVSGTIHGEAVRK